MILISKNTILRRRRRRCRGGFFIDTPPLTNVLLDSAILPLLDSNGQTILTA